MFVYCHRGVNIAVNKKWTFPPPHLTHLMVTTSNNRNYGRDIVRKQ